MSAIRMPELLFHATHCAPCNESLHSLGEQGVNATIAGIKARHLQRMTVSYAEKGIDDSFLNGMHLRALLQEVILRKGLPDDVLEKCDKIIAHLFSSNLT